MWPNLSVGIERSVAVLWPPILPLLLLLINSYAGACRREGMMNFYGGKNVNVFYLWSLELFVEGSSPFL